MSSELNDNNFHSGVELYKICTTKVWCGFYKLTILLNSDVREKKTTIKLNDLSDT